MKKLINSYDLLQGKIETFDWNDYCKNVVILNHHYTSDLLFIDKIRNNAKKIGFIYERNLNTLDFEECNPFTVPSPYEKFTVFTKIDTINNNDFPKEKIAIYRGYSYYAESEYPATNNTWFWDIRRGNPYTGEVSAKKLYADYIRLFCGANGFEYHRTYAINPINTILILILDDIRYILDSEFFSKIHKNYVLFCLISTSSPHEIFIAPDIRANKDSDYQKKIEELKFLLGIEEVNDYL